MRRTRHERQAFGRRLRGLGTNLFNLFRAADSPSPLRNWLGQMLLKNAAATSEQLLPLKHVRLQELADAGFNCADFRFWPKNKLDVAELREFWQKQGRISLRNFREETALEQTPKLPVAYDRSDWSAILDFCRRYNREYHTLVNEALPLKDSLYAGNIILLDEEHYVVSYFEGYGTPRDVDDKEHPELKVYVRKFGVAVPSWAPELFAELAAKLQSFRTCFRPMTVEFSAYPYPVGICRRQEVFWEWRGGAAHDLSAVVARLLERVESCELAFVLDKPRCA